MTGKFLSSQIISRQDYVNRVVIIYKDSGVWKDFGGDNQAKPFSALVQETLNTNDPKTLKEYLIDAPDQQYKPKPIEEKIEMEKIYPESYLDKLLPMKTFYEKRGISSKTQDKFKCGYAGGGKQICKNATKNI